LTSVDVQVTPVRNTRSPATQHADKTSNGGRGGQRPYIHRDPDRDESTLALLTRSLQLGGGTVQHG